VEDGSVKERFDLPLERLDAFIKGTWVPTLRYSASVGFAMANRWPAFCFVSIITLIVTNTPIGTKISCRVQLSAIFVFDHAHENDA
jgi:hypothetical protein